MSDNNPTPNTPPVINISPITIINRALGFLGDRLVTSFDNPETPSAKLMVNNYQMVRRETLYVFPWPFAETWATMPLTSPPPPGPPCYDAAGNQLTSPIGYQNCYALPQDFIRLVDFGDPVQGCGRVQGYRFITNNGQRCIAVDATLYPFGVASPPNPPLGPYTIIDITQNNPGVVTLSALPPPIGTVFTISGVAGMTQVNGQTYTVGSIFTNSFVLYDQFGNQIDTSIFSPYISGGTVTVPASTSVSSYPGSPPVAVSCAYIADVSLLSLWSIGALEVFAWGLAKDVAKSLTGQDKLAQYANEQYALALQNAVGIEGSMQPKLRQTFSRVARDRERVFLGDVSFFTPVGGYYSCNNY